MNISRFSCAFFFPWSFLVLFVLDDVPPEAPDTAVKLPLGSVLDVPLLGLTLVSLFFLERDSDLLVPRITLVMRCTVLSIDSWREILGDLVTWTFASVTALVECFAWLKIVSDGVGDADLLLFSVRKEFDFFTLDVFSFLVIGFSETNSCAKFFNVLDSGLGFNVEAPEKDVWCWGVAHAPVDISRGGSDDMMELVCSSSACSGPSSGIVGWLQDKCMNWYTN